jgi:hypothetical protein
MTTRGVDVLLTAQRFDGRLRKAGAHEWTGPCPKCGGNDRFAVNSASDDLRLISSAFWTSLRAWDR